MPDDTVEWTEAEREELRVRLLTADYPPPTPRAKLVALLRSARVEHRDG